jgi:hypothetical protein
VSELRAAEGLQVGAGKKDLNVQHPAESGLDTHEAFKQLLFRRAWHGASDPQPSQPMSWVGSDPAL